MSSVYHLNALTYSGDLLDEDPELPSWPDPTSWQICAHTLGPTAVIEEMRSAGLGGEGIKAVKVSPSPRNMCTGRPKRMTVPLLARDADMCVSVQLGSAPDEPENTKPNRGGHGR
jgi:hypothetical protein